MFSIIFSPFHPNSLLFKQKKRRRRRRRRRRGGTLTQGSWVLSLSDPKKPTPMIVQTIKTTKIILVRWSCTLILLLDIVIICLWRMLQVDTIWDKNRNACTVNQLYNCSLQIMLEKEKEKNNNKGKGNKGKFLAFEKPHPNKISKWSCMFFFLLLTRQRRDEQW